MNWAVDASCAHLPVDLFFVKTGKSETCGDVRMVIKMCNRCPVQNECLEDALRREDAGSRYGIWGGRTPAERGFIVRERKMDETGLCGDGLHVMDEFNTGRLRGGKWRFCIACRDEHERRYGKAVS